jgi:hypothetical protein
VFVAHQVQIAATVLLERPQRADEHLCRDGFPSLRELGIVHGAHLID